MRSWAFCGNASGQTKNRVERACVRRRLLRESAGVKVRHCLSEDRPIQDYPSVHGYERHRDVPTRFGYAGTLLPTREGRMTTGNTVGTPKLWQGQTKIMYCPVCKGVQTVRSEINPRAIMPWTCRKLWTCERCHVTIATELLPKEGS